MISDNKIYPSKILLVGEYTVTIGGDALAIPFDRFFGRFVVDKNIITEANGLRLLSEAVQKNGVLKEIIDYVKFEEDISRGLSFQSTIPIGYGLGSSGAMTAAFYDRYCNHTVEDRSEIKRRLALIESVFHGNSSGIDPLVSYLHSPIHIKNGETKSITLSDHSVEDVFLIDTKQERNTSTLMQKFKNALQDHDFSNQFEELKHHNSQLINALINGDKQAVTGIMREVSILQKKVLAPMIPDHMKAIWEQGLESNQYYLKICGAGGGGYLLGYTVGDRNKIEDKLKGDIIYLAQNKV